MAATPFQAKKLLILLQYLQRYSDEQHPVSMEEILAEMSSHDVTAERKSIYAYITAMQEMGIDVRSRKRLGWYIGRRQFTLPEVKMLVDAVSSSRFLSQENTDTLIHKLESLCSVYQASVLQRQVYVSGRPKMSNDHLLENVDQLHTAIGQNMAVSFRYFDYDFRHRRVYRHFNKLYIVSPFGLIWNSEKYYLAGYAHDTESLRTYRVDKMDNVKILPQERQGLDKYPDFSLARYENRRFNMYSGIETTVLLRAKKNMANIIWDRFGQDVVMGEDGPNHFRFTITVALSPQFFGWLLGMEGDLEILGPQIALDQYRALLRKALDQEETRIIPESLRTWNPPATHPS